MIPLPTSKVFRSRYGALRWAFWVIVAAVMTAGFGSSGSDAAANESAPAVNSADVQALVAVLDAQK